MNHIKSDPGSSARVAQSFAARLQASPHSIASTHDSRKSVIQAWWGNDILKMCHSADLAEVYRRWIVQAKNGLPRLKDFYEAESHKGSSNTILLLQVHDDFLHVHQSRGLIADIGRDVRGRLLSELQGGIAQDLKPHFAAAIDKREPVYLRYVQGVSEQYVYWEQVALPMVADDSLAKTTFVLGYPAPIDDKTEILKIIFEHFPVGMIAAAPEIGNEPDDAKLLLINTTARRILKFPKTGQPIFTVRDLALWFHNGAQWTQTSIAAKGGRTRITFHDEAWQTNYVVTIEPAGRFILFCITEVS